MTDKNASPNPPSTAPNGCRRSGRGFRVLLAALAATGIGFFAGKAMSHGFPFHAGHFGSHGITRVFAPATVDEASDRAGRIARHLSVEIDATSEQQAKLVDIARRLAADVYPLRKQIADARRQGIDLLRSPAVDRAAVENLRTDQMARIEEISRRVSVAFADAAEIMSPEQRTRLATRIETFSDRFGWWKRWRHE